ncbi:HAMP domain-containing sensor histidine kinase [Bdellovibrionota bacterium FG-1]
MPNSKRDLDFIETSEALALWTLASTTAHEVNNPLSVIRAFASMLRNSLGNEKFSLSTQLEYIEKIDSTVVRISESLGSVVGGLRPDRSQPFEKVPLEGIVSSALDLCRARLEKQGIAVAVDVPSEIVLECQGTWMTVVFVQLLLRAMKGAGTWIRIVAAVNEGQVEIGVEDGGTVPSEGGLSMVRKVLEIQGGTLSLDSTSAHTRLVVKVPGLLDGAAGS